MQHSPGVPRCHQHQPRAYVSSLRQGLGACGCVMCMQDNIPDLYWHWLWHLARPGPGCHVQDYRGSIKDLRDPQRHQANLVGIRVIFKGWNFGRGSVRAYKGCSPYSLSLVILVCPCQPGPQSLIIPVSPSLFMNPSSLGLPVSLGH